MNWLDLILLLPPFAMLFRGWQRGFFKQLFSLGAILLASGVAVYANQSFVVALWKDEKTVDYFSANMLFIFISILIILVILLYLGRFFTKLFDALRLGGINSFLGSVFGFAKGSVFSLLIAFLIQATSLHVPDWQQEQRRGSVVFPYCKSLNAIVLDMLLGSEDVDWRDVLPDDAPKRLLI
jgi:uncharacterized membrane protein required for colicin V production